MWVKLEFERVMVDVVVPEGLRKKRGRLWTDMSRTFGREGIGYKLCAIVGEDVTGAIEVTGENMNGKRGRARNLSDNQFKSQLTNCI